MAKKKDTEMEVDGSEMELDADHAEPRVYEIGFHIDPELSQEEAKVAFQAIRDRAAAGGEIVAEGEIEKIPLAYTISRMETGGRRDFNSAYFGWIVYEAAGEGHEAVLAAVRGDSRVVRFLDVRTTKEAAKHAAEMHEFYRRAPQAEEPASEEEESADAELDTALKEAGV